MPLQPSHTPPPSDSAADIDTLVDMGEQPEQPTPSPDPPTTDA